MDKQTEESGIDTQIINELVQSSEIRVNHLMSLFLKLTPETLRSMIEKVRYLEDSELTAQCMYYLILFRREKHIHTLFESHTLPLEVIEYLIMSLYGWALREEQSDYRLITDLLSFFDQETYMKLLLDSKLISRDDLLIYYIVPKLNRLNLEEYFNTREDISHFLNAFMALPDDLRTGILKENTDFYGYISMILASSGRNITLSNYTMDKKHESIHKTQNLIMDIVAHFDMEKESSLPINQRNQLRIGKIVNLIRKFDSSNIIEVMKKEGVIIDSEEESLIHEILYNPLFKDLLKKYCEEPQYE